MPAQNGVFARLYSWVQQNAAGFNIDPSKIDADTDDIVDYLNLAFPIDGSKAAAADMPMGGHGMTGLRRGALAGEAVTFDQMNEAVAAGQGAPSTAVAVSAALTLDATHKGKVLQLSGSGYTVTGPAAAVATRGYFVFISKKDGNGVVKFTPASGTVDGLASISIYQEAFILWTDGTNWFSQGRPRGLISIGRSVISSPVTSVLFAVGFDDPELRDMMFSWDGVVASTSFQARLLKNAALATGSYVSQQTPNQGSPTSGFYLDYASGTGTHNGDLLLTNFASSTPKQQRAAWRGMSVDVPQPPTLGEGYQNTLLPIQGASFSAIDGSNLTAGAFTHWGRRP